MVCEINPSDTTRGKAFALWMNAPNPMVTFLKTFNVTNLVRISRRQDLKFNMLLDYCIGKAASTVKEFYLLPVGGKLMQYDALAVNTIVKNCTGEVSSCDILFTDDLRVFNDRYLQDTAQTASRCEDHDLSDACMVIGTSAILEMNKVEICGVDTSKLPMLPAKEMRALMLRVKAGDHDAREQFIHSNLRLVLSVVQRFQNRGEQMDDLFQVGCIGLIKAIDNFDLRHDVRFSTYAVPMIIGEIRRHLRDNNAIRVSRSLRDTAYKALQARTRLSDANAKEPTLADIAKELGLPEEDVTFALDAIQEPVSLFEPVFRDDGDAIFVIDQISDNKTSDANWLDHIALSEGMHHLTEREMRILKLRFFLGKTQMEVSREIGISQAQVSRLEKGALRQLQKYV